MMMSMEINVWANTPPHTDYPVVEVPYDELFDEGVVDVTWEYSSDNTRMLLRLNEAEFSKDDHIFVYPTTFTLDCVTVVDIANVG
jgi:hypothetical protein